MKLITDHQYDFKYYQLYLFTKVLLSLSVTNGADGWLWYDMQNGKKVQQIFELAFINDEDYFLIKFNILIISLSLGWNKS